LHKPHSVNLCKLCGCCYKSIEKDTGQKNTYFCSELVASIYKILEILPEEKAAERFIPGSFEGPLANTNFINGASLDHELLIDFNL